MHRGPFDLPTPTSVVDLDVLEANIAAMASSADTRGIALRPHAKTHKSVEIARRQAAAGAHGLTVATVGEAEVFAGAGFEDLFVAYPLWVDADRGRRLRALLEQCSLTVGVDSTDAVRRLAAQLHGDVGVVRVLVEVDSGHHRSGLLPPEAGEVAEVAAHSGLRVEGVYTFPGHGYSPDARVTAAEQEQEMLTQAAEVLRDHGIEPSVRSGGSTPTADLARAGGVTELRPGVYVFGDAQQLDLGVVSPDRIAFTVWSTVVSHAGGNLVLDAGSKVLGADRAPWASGYGRLLDHPDATIHQLSEHHAVVTWPDGSARPGIGSHLRVVPNHVCNAVNLVDELAVAQGGEIVDRWLVDARGRNT